MDKQRSYTQTTYVCNLSLRPVQLIYKPTAVGFFYRRQTNDTSDDMLRNTYNCDIRLKKTENYRNTIRMVNCANLERTIYATAPKKGRK